MNKLAMLDRKLLEMLQNDFPLTPDPFYDLAEALETDVDEIGERIQRLKESGIIRRIGAIFDAKRNVESEESKNEVAG